MSARVLVISAQDCVTLLLALAMLEKFAQDEQREARRQKNARKQQAMQAMLDQIVDLRVKLGGAS